MIGDYIIGETLGQGCFGKVKLGTHLVTKKQYALKMIEGREIKSEKSLLMVQREIKIMSLLAHENIVKLETVLQFPDQDITCLVLELVEGGELFDYILDKEGLPEVEARFFFRQIVSAIDYTHSKLVVHRDLKPENILLDVNGNIKISDFGLSNIMNPDSRMHSLVGSPHYIPPEVHLGQSYIGPEMDMWALGVILYAMVTGDMPWCGNTLQQQIDNAIRGKYHVPGYVSGGCADLIAKLLCIDPKARATVAGIRNHPWLNEGYDCPPSTREVPGPVYAKDLDWEVLSKMRNLGFDETTVTIDLLNTKQPPQSASLYHLLLDHKKLKEETRLRTFSDSEKYRGESDEEDSSKHKPNSRFRKMMKPIKLSKLLFKKNMATPIMRDSADF